MGLDGTSDTAPLDVGGFEVGWRDARGEHRRTIDAVYAEAKHRLNVPSIRKN